MVRHPLRLAVCSVIGLVLAGLLFLQAGSSVLTYKQPPLAVQLMPVNGLALEQAAARQFMAGVKTEADIPASAAAALPLARAAFAHDPLSPKSLAIMAMAQTDPQARRDILEKASAINRRDLLLQGLVLEDAVARKDYAGALATFDRILRVHPEQSATFFPILTNALKNPAAAQELGAILERDSPWHKGFLEFAASDGDALPNLARLRLTKIKVDTRVDQRLISGLVKRGNIGLAHQVYRKATGQEEQTGRLGWGQQFPPFDWKMADEPGFRAQPSLGDIALDVFIRGGKGGILAERLVRSRDVPGVLKITHRLAPAGQVADVRVQISCPGDETPLLDRPLRIQPMRIPVPALASRCGFMRVALYGRAWSGRSSIRGEITQFEFADE